MTGNNHLLQKVTFEIGLSSREGAYEIQNRISDAFQSVVLRELEKFLDSKSTPDEIITIDKIEIELGSIRLDKLEAELAESVGRELHTFFGNLEEEIAQARSTSPSSTPGRMQVRWPLKNNAHFTAEVHVKGSAYSKFGQVTHLLQFGFIKDSGSNVTRIKLRELIREVLEENIDAFVAFIRSTYTDRVVMQRLLLNLSQGQLQYIIAHLGCDFSGDIAPLLVKIENFLRVNSLDAFIGRLPSGVYLTSPLQKLWWHLFDYYIRPANRLGDIINSGQIDSRTALIQTLVLNSLANKLSINGITSGSIHLPEDHRAKVYTTLNTISTLINGNIIHGQKIRAAIEELRKTLLHIADNGINAPLKKSEHKNSISVFDELDTDTVYNPGVNVPDDHKYVRNAGLIILGPYLRHYFLRLGLLDGKQFSSKEAAWKAVHALQHLCGFDQTEQNEGWSESDLLFNKIICGLDISEPVPETLALTGTDLEESDALLKSVLANWTIMRRSSIHVLQSTFFHKKGRLSRLGNDWEVLIERDSAVEILIDKLPWGINMLKLPWNEYTIHTHW